MNHGRQSLVLLVTAGVIVVGLTLWRMGLFPPPTVEIVTTIAPPITVPSLERDAAEPEIRYPVETPASVGPLAARQIGQALIDLLGREPVATFLQIDDFPRRFVATVDNLGRSYAPSALWPVNPTRDRFTVEQVDGDAVIATDNAARYTPLVLLVESVDTTRAVSLYFRMYPLLQRAYEELGYPGRHFNDRLIAVIDQLLDTPNVEYPVKLQLMEVKGPVASLRPWVRYEFADPSLESLAAGQKMLVRAGPENQRRLKKQLAELRAELVGRSAKR